MSDKKNKQLDDTWDPIIRDFLKEFASQLVKSGRDLGSTANALGMTPTSIDHMKRYGKGSVVSWLKLIVYKFELSEQDLKYFLHNFSKLLNSAREEVVEADMVWEEASKYGSDVEKLAWARLLLAKLQVEADLGLRPNHKTKKKK